MSDERTGYVGSARLREAEGRLSGRDRAVLGFLSRHRYATTGHIRDLHFAQHASTSAATRACIRVLHRLLRDRLVARLERSVGGYHRGSAAFVWYLDAAGERLTRPSDAARRRFATPSIQFLDHTLAIVDAYVTLVTGERDDSFRIERIEIETEAWRTYLQPSGATGILKPDLYAHLSTPEYDDHWYLEIDRGTEHQPVLLAKSRAYAAYRATGRAQAEHGAFPRVLWVMPTQRRTARLTAAIASEPDLPDRLFLAITPDQLLTTIRDPPDT